MFTERSIYLSSRSQRELNICLYVHGQKYILVFYIFYPFFLLLLFIVTIHQICLSRFSPWKLCLVSINAFRMIRKSSFIYGYYFLLNVICTAASPFYFPLQVPYVYACLHFSFDVNYFLQSHIPCYLGFSVSLFLSSL